MKKKQDSKTLRVNRMDLNAVMGRQNKYSNFWYQPRMELSYPAIATFAKSSATSFSERWGPAMTKLTLYNWPTICDVSGTSTIPQSFKNRNVVINFQMHPNSSVIGCKRPVMFNGSQNNPDNNNIINSFTWLTRKRLRCKINIVGTFQAQKLNLKANL